MALVVAAAISTACGTSLPPSASPPAAETPAPTLAASAATPSGSPVAGTLTAVSEPGLLGHVPATVDGITLTYDPTTTASVAADPAFAHDASALAMAIAAAPDNSGSTDVAVVSVVRLRVATLTDEVFRTYRDSYDKATCASAGGVSGHAQATMHDRLVFIGSCAGGAFTYHVGLADGPLIVSAASVGQMRLGEKVMNGVTP